MSTEPVTVAILGSCISRDVFNTRFNEGYKAMWNCVLLQNQSSLISIMSPPVKFLDDDYGDEIGDYARMQVRRDTSREFLDELREARPSYLVVDFFGDVHFGVLDLGDGTYVTNNRWMLWKTDWYHRHRESGDLSPIRLEEDPERYLALWRDALDQLVAFVDEHLPQTTVVVHRGRNAERWLGAAGGQPKSLLARKKIFKVDIDVLNENWRTLDDIACAIDGWETVDLTDREYLSFKGHPWGVFYVHYTLDYYDEFLAALNVVHLRSLFEDGTTERAMVEQLAGARTARHRELGEHVARVRSLQQRVRRLRADLEAATRRPDPLAGRIVRTVQRRLARR